MDITSLSLNDKIQLKNQLEAETQMHKINIQNIVGKKL
jgi:hypothetical protein